ncbi:MAG: DNA polymerase III subunit delta' [Longispora sp.]|nr:DNA polymerase III subunit delta' [Longispora sp. (in: high G+C Gram-positive bacteria)]
MDMAGQDSAVSTLRAAAAAAGQIVNGVDVPHGVMTHAWLFTGPPGSGRSTAARAFAAALQCAEGGCGRCHACHTASTGTHADVRFVVSEGLSISVDEIRTLILQASGSPTQGRWQVLLIADADRLTEAAGNALLKAIEEPPPRTVFLLCAPSTHPEDVSVTIRSRCRVLTLGTPSAETVAAVLTERDGIAAADALWAAAAAQGHIEHARRLATDDAARQRRAAVLGIPRSLTGVSAAFDAAATLIAATEEEAAAAVVDVSAREKSEMETALGAGGTGKGAAAAARGTAGILKDLERRQKSRATRAKRDALDRALVDLAGLYRDILVWTVGATVSPIHADVVEMTRAAGEKWTPESTLRRLEAVLACREAIDANVKPRIAVESMMLRLWRG